MKKILLLVLSFLFAALLTACGAGNIANNVAGEASKAAQSAGVQSAALSESEESGPANTEEPVATTDDTTDVPDVNVSSDSGNLQAGSNLSWPASSMGDIPELSGNITVVLTADGSSSVAFSGITQDQAESYVSSLKSLGYQGYSYNDDQDGIIFGGQNSTGATVTFAFNSTSGETTVTYTPPTE